MIKVKNLNKFYNKGSSSEIHVINEVSLELPSQGLVSFLGPSGSGKTTLLNVIGGLDKAKGEISYNNEVIEKYSMSRIDALRSKEIGYVFQNYNLLLEETVYNNLAIALELIGIYDKKEQEKRIEYTLTAVGMYKFRKKRAYALSGGQQQRVSIARALVKKAKVIIADEPTGNLDSENTIEVMNILKKISKVSLVLMVTHNDEVANYYSDTIIKIKDGKILETISNTQTGSLSLGNENAIYLKDCKEQKASFDSNEIKIYSEESNNSYKITIYEKNGVLYIDSPQKIKLLQDTNLKIINDYYKVNEANHAADVSTFDNSWYDDSKTRKNIFGVIASSLKKSFNQMRYSKKRTKFLYFSFAIIGILLGFCVFGYTSYSTIDDTQLVADADFSRLASDNDIDYLQFDFIQNKALSEGAIDDLSEVTTMRLTLSKSVNFQENLEYEFICNVLPYFDNSSVNVYLGKEPQANEIVLGKQYAKFIVDNYYNFFPSYESLVGQILANNYSGVEYLISGISDNTTNVSYLSDYDYVKSYEPSSVVESLYFYRDYKYESKYETYNITAGRDFTEADLEYDSLAGDPQPIILPSNFSSDAESLVGKDIEIKYAANQIFPLRNCHVIGLYEMKDFETAPDELMTYDKYLSFNFVPTTRYCYDNYDYKIVEGKDATNYDECVVTMYSKYTLGDVINGRTVVGLYNATRQVHAKKVLCDRDFVIYNGTTANNRLFKVTDDAELTKLISAYCEDSKIINSYLSAVEPMQEAQKSNMMIFGLFTIGLLAGITVFMYFMMRSRMVNEIYNIGVYRCLGASKKHLLGRFLSEIFVLISLTSLIGYIITILLINGIFMNINSIINQKISMLSVNNIFAGVGVLYLLAFIFGMLPIWTLLRKTPAEIVAKYDI